MKSPFPTLPIALLSLLALVSTVSADPFPRPPGLEPDVRFWKRVYTEVDTSGGLIHDTRDLRVVYEVVRFPPGTSSRSRERQVEKVKTRYARILESLGRGKRSGLSSDEKRVLALFPDGVSNTTLRNSRKQIRFQLGQADKFKGGMIRASKWEPHIRETFRDMGLPEELAALPHVESSYTPTAYSRIGAAGLWQFTRSTGRRFMRVDHVVDERLDPDISTVAAARLLKQNYASTGTWPLAITSYNHGASGMRRAARKMGTTDIERIVRKYKSRTFGFASRNFYVEFLAAAEVDRNAERYFGKIVGDAPTTYETIEMPFYAHAAPLRRALGVDLATLQAANPSLRPSVWNGTKRVPRGFELKLPRGSLARPFSQALAAVPKSNQYASQTRDRYHVVQRGDTLSGISARYRVSMRELSSLNGLRSRHRIRIGQKLRLPDDGSSGSAGKSFARVSSGAVAPPASGIYTVRRGDTLTRIGRRYGLSERELVELNGLANRNRIYVGQKLAVARGVSDEPVRSAPQAVAALATPKPEPADPAPARATELAAIEAEPPTPGGAVDPAPTSMLSADEAVGVAPPSDPLPYGPELLADPSNYSVSSDGTIEVQASETLGHYAEWLGIRASRLRQINRLRYGESLRIGQSLRLDLARTTPEEFEVHRLSHHRQIQGAFFEQYEIEGTLTHVTRRGDSIWYLSQRRYQVPLWLIRQYNPDLDLSTLNAGTRIAIPNVKQRSEWSG